MPLARADTPKTDAWFAAATAALAAPAGTGAPERSAALLKKHYHLSGEVTFLSSETERTEGVRLADGRSLILKTSARPEAADSFRFQSAALAALSGTADVRAPEVLRTDSSGLMFEDDGIFGYLQTRIEGTALHMVELTPARACQTGRALAWLDIALAKAELPGAHRPVLWNIDCWPRLMRLAQYLPEAPVAEHVHAAMEDYAGLIAPLIAELTWQVTHNDPSPHNTLLTGEGTAFIDFGDGGWNPRLQDLAIAASHLVSDPGQVLGGAEHLVAGYANVLPLTGLETCLLVGLMRARQSALILINYWRSHLFPSESAYITKNVARAERGLSILARLNAAEAEAAVAAAMSLPHPNPLQTGSMP